MSPKVTVVMPSLNVAGFIRPCVESVLCQRLSDIEILAIDAGSVDGTLEILKEYEKKDFRLKVIKSEKKSYGYQINLGLSLAKGKYVGIVETDDIIAPDMYEVLYEAAEKFGADYVKGYAEAFVYIAEKEIWKQPIARFFIDQHMVGKKVAPCGDPQLLVMDIYLWLGIYRREFLQDIKLNETPGAAFQDQGFLFQTISRAKCAVYLDKPVYLYRQDNEDSSIYNKKGFQYLVNEYSINKKYLKGKQKEWQIAFYQRMLNQSLGRFQMMALSGTFWLEAMDDIQNLRGTLQQAVDEGLLNKDISAIRWQELQLFLESPLVVYENYVEEYQEKRTIINGILNNIGERKAVIFGCGNRGKFLHVLLEHRKRGCVAGYCDNRCREEGEIVQGIEVLKPEDAVLKYSNSVYVIANKYHADEMKEQLCFLGIQKDNILTYMFGIDMLLLRLRD